MKKPFHVGICVLLFPILSVSCSTASLNPKRDIATASAGEMDDANESISFAADYPTKLEFVASTTDSMETAKYTQEDLPEGSFGFTDVNNSEFKMSLRVKGKEYDAGGITKFISQECNKNHECLKRYTLHNDHGDFVGNLKVIKGASEKVRFNGFFQHLPNPNDPNPGRKYHFTVTRAKNAADLKD